MVGDRYTPAWRHGGVGTFETMDVSEVISGRLLGNGGVVGRHASDEHRETLSEPDAPMGIEHDRAVREGWGRTPERCRTVGCWARAGDQMMRHDEPPPSHA